LLVLLMKPLLKNVVCAHGKEVTTKVTAVAGLINTTDAAIADTVRVGACQFDGSVVSLTTGSVPVYEQHSAVG
jgi:hypothetical protein